MAGRPIKGVLVRRQLHKGYARKWKTTRYAGGYLFVAGMERIAAHERALLELMLEGTGEAPGLRHIKGITVKMDDPDLTQRDLIVGAEFDRMDVKTAAKELEKRGVVAFERSAESSYSNRMVREFDSEGVVRLSPLHVNTPAEITQFLRVAAEVAAL